MHYGDNDTAEIASHNFDSETNRKSLFKRIAFNQMNRTKSDKCERRQNQTTKKEIFHFELSNVRTNIWNHWHSQLKMRTLILQHNWQWKWEREKKNWKTKEENWCDFSTHFFVIFGRTMCVQSTQRIHWNTFGFAFESDSTKTDWITFHRNEEEVELSDLFLFLFLLFGICVSNFNA